VAQVSVRSKNSPRRSRMELGPTDWTNVRPGTALE